MSANLAFCLDALLCATGGAGSVARRSKRRDRMKLRLAAMIVLCGAAAGLGGTRSIQWRDQTLTIGKPFVPNGPAAEVTKLRFCPAIEQASGQPCTLIQGILTSHLPNPEFVVTVTIQMFRYRPGNGHLHTAGVAKIQVPRPLPGKPTRFEGLGPDWYGRSPEGAPAGPAPSDTPRYLVTFEITKYRPEDHPFAREKAKAPDQQ